MISNLDEIRDRLDIVEVVSRRVSLQPKGVRWLGLCPFHAEKTPSFFVSPQRQFCHCFGCGFSGDAIAFEQKASGLSFRETVASLAQTLGIEIQEDGASPLDENAYFHRERLYITNARVLEHWQQQFLPEKAAENTRLGNRWFSTAAVEHFGVCSTPSSDDFSAGKCGDPQDQAAWLELGIIREQGGKMRDFFRDRLVFPILTESGKVAGFSGRVCGEMRKNTPKYLNSPESAVFKKSNLLFGLFENKAAIRAAGEVLVVEGFTDILRLWEQGFPNAVALCGTALTKHHAAMLKKYATKATLLLDGDLAGQKAANAAFPVLEHAGIFVRVCPLPDAHDPESYLMEMGSAAFLRHLLTASRDAIVWYVESKIQKQIEGPDKQQLADYCQKYLRNTAFPALSLKWAAEIAALLGVDEQYFLPHADQAGTSVSGSDTPISVENNCYFFQERKGGKTMISNFVLRPLFRSKSGKEVFWVFELQNCKGEKCRIRFNGKSLNSADCFRQTVEQKGNFIFHGNIPHLNHIKALVFDCLPEFSEIERLGWQRQHGFWAWSNGISVDGKFVPADSGGIATLDDGRTFLIEAALEEDWAASEADADERMFRHECGNVSFLDWCAMITDVYAENQNGHLMVLYYLTSIFRDIVFWELKFFPHLLAFGPMGTGKTQMARSLGKMFGKPQTQLMLDSSTEVGMGRKAAKFSNAVVWFDEYKNAIPAKRIQFLKGLYDGAGHVRGEYTNDLKTNEVAVQSGVFITGQELPVADPALFSRVVLLRVTQTQFSEAQRAAFNRLKSVERTEGLSHVTGWLSGLREHVEPHFSGAFRRIFRTLSDTLKTEHPEKIFEDRLINNHAVLMTVLALLEKPAGFAPHFMASCNKALVDALVAHHQLMASSDDRAQFWDTVGFLQEEGKLTSEDILLEPVHKVTLRLAKGQWDKRMFEVPKPLLFLRTARVFPQYNITFRQQFGREGLSKATIESYLKGSPAYLGYCDSKRFPSGTVNSCLVFDWALLGLDWFGQADDPDTL